MKVTSGEVPCKAGTRYMPWRLGDAKWLSTTQMYCKQRSQQQAGQPEVFMTVLV